MIKYTELTKNNYKISDLATLFGVTAVTLRAWEKEGRINFLRTEGKARYLTKDLLVKELDKRGLRSCFQNHIEIYKFLDFLSIMLVFS